MFDSLRTRLLLWYTLILAMVIVTFAGTVCYLYWRSLLTEIDRNLLGGAQAMAQALRPSPAGGFDLDVPAEYRDVDLPAGAGRSSYAVWNATGELIDRSSPDDDIPLPLDAGFRTRAGQREFATVGPGGATVLVGRELGDVRRQVLSLGGTVAGAGGVVLVLSLLGGWFLVGRALAPVARISAAATAMSHGDLSVRIAIEHTDNELEQVALALNEGLDRLRQAAEAQRRFTADASHELRTPLATLTAECDWALARHHAPADYRQTVEICQRATSRMRRIVDGLLTLARGDNPNAPLKRVSLPLAPLVEDAIGLFDVLAARSGITIETRLEQARVTGDPDRLSELVTNLLSNAIEYNRHAGTVRVEVSREAQEVCLRVADTGTGIAAEDLPRIFDRFYRADKSRGRQTGGAGLGLAIVKWIVDAHGGRVACRSALGKGTEMLVWLPAAPMS